MTTDMASYQLADIFVSTKGAKSAQLSEEGGPVYWTSPTVLAAPFGPGNFDKDPAASRMNLEFRTTPEILSFFEGLDSWAIEYLSTHSERLFKKPMTHAQVEECYHSAIRTSEKYDPLLRTKINVSGPRGCSYWTPGNERTVEPTHWKTAELQPRLHISHLWIMGKECGLVLNCTDLLVRERAEAACPF